MKNKEIVYRGECELFDHSDGFIPSIYRYEHEDSILFVKERIVDFYNKYKGILLQLNDLEGDNETVKAKNRIKNLGVLQHYGIPTPLLDVTSNQDVALYFACHDKFNSDGYVYSFDEQKMAGFDTVTVQKRMSVIWENVVSDNKLLRNGAFSFDYSKLFSTNINNNRYKNQSGKFILHSYEIDGSNVKPSFVKETSAEMCLKIDAKEKINELMKLALEKGITYEYLFPDSDKSIQLYKLYKTKSRQDLSKLDEIKTINCTELTDRLVKSFDGFVFTMTSLYEFSKQIKNSDGYLYSKLIDECKVEE